MWLSSLGDLHRGGSRHLLVDIVSFRDERLSSTVGNSGQIQLEFIRFRDYLPHKFVVGVQLDSVNTLRIGRIDTHCHNPSRTVLSHGVRIVTVEAVFESWVTSSFEHDTTAKTKGINKQMIAAFRTIVFLHTRLIHAYEKQYRKYPLSRSDQNTP